jgi:hypothetical protein
MTNPTKTRRRFTAQQKQHNHHSGVVGLLAAGILLAVEPEDGIEIQLVDQIQQKKRQMVLG